jgi:hypothetical protein
VQTRRAAPPRDSVHALALDGLCRGLVVAQLLDGVYQRQVEHVGHEADTDALDLVRPRLHQLAHASLLVLAVEGGRPIVDIGPLRRQATAASQGGPAPAAAPAQRARLPPLGLLEACRPVRWAGIRHR